MNSKILTLGLLLGALNLPAHAATFSNLGILGDSLSDTGRLAAATSSATFGLFSVPAAPYFPGRFSNGPVWADYYQAANPQITVNNLAFGGAFSGPINGRDNTGDDELGAVPLFGSLLQSAAVGLDSELALVPDVSGTNTAFVLWIGANDINSATSLGYARPQDIVSLSLTNVNNAVNTLLGRGAVEIYVANLPDLGRTPSGIASGNAGDLSEATINFNNGLVNIVSGAGPAVKLVNIYSPFNVLLANAAFFGITDITTPCVDGLFDSSACADPNAHLFWDTIHPTTIPHALLSNLFTDAFNATAVPLPASSVLLGPVLGWLVCRNRRAAIRGPVREV